jgi:hypothetical protein
MDSCGWRLETSQRRSEDGSKPISAACEPVVRDSTVSPVAPNEMPIGTIWRMATTFPVMPSPQRQTQEAIGGREERDVAKTRVPRTREEATRAGRTVSSLCGPLATGHTAASVNAATQSRPSTVHLPLLRLLDSGTEVTQCCGARMLRPVQRLRGKRMAPCRGAKGMTLV